MANATTVGPTCGLREAYELGRHVGPTVCGGRRNPSYNRRMSRTRRSLYLVAKTLLALALLAAVGWYFAKLIRDPALAANPPTLRLEYLVPAGLLYLSAHVVWATFFVQLLHYEGSRVSWMVGVRAYFVSQMGKYVPGKVAVIVLRLALLRPHGVSPAVVAVTATYETLVSMAAGATIGICTLPFTGFADAAEGVIGSWMWVGLAGVGGLPLALGLLNRIAARVAEKRRGPDSPPLPSPSVRMLFRGVAQDSVGWAFLGLSLWLCVQGVTPQPTHLTTEAYLGAVSIVSLSYVAGFVMLIVPGGLGAREGVMQAMLARQVASVLGAGLAGPVAAVVALVLRLVWTSFEVVCALSLWWFARPAAVSPPPVSAVFTASEVAHG